MQTELVRQLDHLGSPRILVIGDVILDRYIWGEAQRVSPEAPILVLQVENEQVRLGGAASVAAMLRTLGAEVSIAGVIGADVNGSVVERLSNDFGIRSQLVEDRERWTTVKERVMGSAGKRNAHQILRLDREHQKPLNAQIEAKVLEAIRAELNECQLVVVSDYDKGTCTPSILSYIIRDCRIRAIPVFVDPARISSFEKYRGANLLCPNRIEAEKVLGYGIDTGNQAMVAGEELRHRYQVDYILLKLDSDGMTFVEHGGKARYIRARVRDVHDVTGAGDMVIAVTAICRASKIPWDHAVHFANVAAGLEVERLGATPLSRHEIRNELIRHESSLSPKLVSNEELNVHVSRLRKQGKTVVFTNGCFDLLHVGHVTYLREAARRGDILVVAINSDRSVRLLKGNDRPVITQQDRATLLEALQCVDYVTVFDERTPESLIKQIRPDVLVKGGNYRPEEVVGRHLVEDYGGQVVVVSKTDGVSTTRILDSVRRFAANSDGRDVVPM